MQLITISIIVLTTSLPPIYSNDKPQTINHRHNRNSKTIQAPIPDQGPPIKDECCETKYFNNGQYKGGLFPIFPNGPIFPIFPYRSYPHYYYGSTDLNHAHIQPFIQPQPFGPTINQENFSRAIQGNFSQRAFMGGMMNCGPRG